MLENTNILNSGKNTQKALKLIEQWIPQVETFETNIRLIEKSLKQSEEEKRFLANELNDRKDDNFHNQIEIAGLKNELNKWKRLYNKVPEEIRTEIECRKREHQREVER